MNITTMPYSAPARPACATCGHGTAPAAAPPVDGVELSGGPPPGGHMGVHGMLVAGDRYFSHIPMFHVPHDYQIVLDVKLSHPDLPEGQNYGGKLHTFVPDRFSLGDLISGDLKHFEGTLYEGNFETQGSRPLAEHVQADVRQVLRTEHLDGQSKGSPDLEYTLFGTPQDAYLLHHISGDAAFDQLLGAHVETGTLSAAQLAEGVTVTIPGHRNSLETRLVADRQPVEARVEGSDQPLTLGVDRELSILLGPGFDHGPETPGGGHGHSH